MLERGILECHYLNLSKLNLTVTHKKLRNNVN